MDIKKIYNEDCLKAMKEMKDNQFDLAIVDPPYMNNNIGLQSNGIKRTKFHLETFIKPNKDYFKELFRVSKNQIIWGGNYFTNDLPESRGWICWDKIEHGKNFSKFELAWTSFDKIAEIFRQNNHGGFVAKGINKKIHPTQKHIKLYEWLLMNYAKEGDKILDTHLGSGSIALACHNLGFDLTACELDKEYYNAAIKRIEQHKAQIRMF